MSEQFYLFLDLETAGLAYDAPIFEVGCILTEFTDGQFVPRDEYHGIVSWHRDFEDHLNDFTREMHTGNGLLMDMGRDSALAVHDDEGADGTETLHIHTAAIGQMIGRHLGQKFKGKVHLAGSGVSHFDLRRVNDQMPYMATWLHWRPLDVGQLEEWNLLLSMPTYDVAIEQGTVDDAEPKTHRAMDDIRYHLRESNWYCRWIADWQHALPKHNAPAGVSL